jgi:hypothetical protein
VSPGCSTNSTGCPPTDAPRPAVSFPDPWKPQLEVALPSGGEGIPTSVRLLSDHGADRQGVDEETNTARRKKSPRRPTWPLGLSESNEVRPRPLGGSSFELRLSNSNFLKRRMSLPRGISVVAPEQPHSDN